MDHDERYEQDLLGTSPVPSQALYGIHTVRAINNFPLTGRHVHPALIKAFAAVKQACAQTNLALGHLEEAVAKAIIAACEEMRLGSLDEHVVVDALQGGAGTSTNMNINEVLTNRALQLIGCQPGTYDRIDPLSHVNLHQSTNDTYPTALKLAALDLLVPLEVALVALQEACQGQERALAGVVKVGRTQLQDACLTTLGRSCGAWGEAIGRDRWRVFKCRERLRVVNLGGTAIGTGLGAPRRFIFQAAQALRALTAHPLARAENLVDATQNVDVFAEVSGILSACAANLGKIAGDLRLLSSGPQAGLGELHLPARQAGSSIMPGKINPVIPEAVLQTSMLVIGHHQTITSAVARGEMELNAFLPLIADLLLHDLTMLRQAAHILTEHCIRGLKANVERCRQQVHGATATLTALVPHIGYHRAQELADYAAQHHCDLASAAERSGIMTAETFATAIAPQAVNRLGHPDD